MEQKTERAIGTDGPVTRGTVGRTSIVDDLPVAAILADRTGIIRHANDHAARMLGFSRDEMQGLAVDELLPESLRAAHGGFVRSFFQSTHSARRMTSGREFQICRKDGTIFFADISLTIILDGGESLGLACIVDLTPHHGYKTDLARSNRALRLLSTSNRTLLRASDMQTLLDDVCRLAIEKGGYRLAWIGYAEHDDAKSISVQAKAGPSLDYLDDLAISWGDTPLGSGPTGRAIRTGAPVTARFILTEPAYHPWRRAAMAHVFQSSIALPLRFEVVVFGALTLYATEPDAFDDSETQLLEEVADDVAFGIEVVRTRGARDEAEKNLEYLAYTDFVTGLPNRAALLDLLDQAFAGGQSGALLFIGLDHFKEINDAYGYLVGDQVLKLVGEKIASTLQNDAILTRIGGDEFGLVLQNGGRTQAGHAALRLTEALEQPLFIEALGSITFSAKIGIVLYPEGRATPNEVFADAGLASRKSAGTMEGYCFYSPQMSAQLFDHLEIAQKLNLAIAEGDLDLHYQPKVDLISGKIIGAEALLRWYDPGRGPIGPNLFVPIAEERGLMPALGTWVLKKACRQLAAWKELGLTFPGKLAVNVSAKQMDVPDFVATVVKIVEESGCQPQDFELEITESALAADGPAAIGKLQDLTARGFCLAIDDFGTGFSSLAYLSKFPAGTLKIDISFVRTMLKSQNDHVIVETIIGMAKSLGLNTVAEGVETEEQARALLSLGCRIAQGYLYGRPEAADNFEKLWIRPKA